MTPILHDDDNTAITLREQQAAKLELHCSVCEAQVRAPSELDASGRCLECQP